jgi:hypothetical protein
LSSRVAVVVAITLLVAVAQVDSARELDFP